MMKTITMNRREVERLYALFNQLNESGDHGSVTLSQKNSNGIGSVLTATFIVTHKDEEGEFTVIISDESDW